MLDLASIYPDLRPTIETQLSRLKETPISELGRSCETLCAYFRTAGVAALLCDLDVGQFGQMLVRSALTRKWLLTQFGEAERESNSMCRLTKANGFFDAVASQFDLAREIAHLSPGRWNPMYEYEDDYCYIRFLQELVCRADWAIMREIFERFERVLDGSVSARLDVCKAFLDSDEVGFQGAFFDLLETWNEYVEAERRSLTRNEIEFASAEHVSIECLAILRIAESVNFPTEPEYVFCPLEVRAQFVVAMPIDLLPS